MMNEDKTQKKISKIGSKTLHEWLFSYSFLAYPLILFAVFYVYVNIDAFFLSFQKIDMLENRTFVGFDNFEAFITGIFAHEGLLKTSFINSLKMYIIALIITMPLYIIFSWLLFREFFGHKVVRIVIMLPSIISEFVYCLVFRNFAGNSLQTVMQQFGFVNFPNLIDDSAYAFGTTLFYQIWISFSTSLIVYPNAMRAIDPSIFESARIDGLSSMWKELWFIILPQIFPTISTFLVLGFSGIFTGSGPLVAFYMYSAPEQAYNIGYFMFKTTYENVTNTIGYPLVAAGGMILTVIIGPLTLLLKWFLDKVSPVEQ